MPTRRFLQLDVFAPRPGTGNPLAVVLDSEDDVPAHMTTRLHGLRVMARDPEGWCVAVDGQRMNCRIHASRPAVCRSFAMGGPCCRSVRAAYARSGSRTIESTLA